MIFYSNNIITIFNKYLSFTTKIYLDSHRDEGKTYKLKVSGVRSIENVIKFLNKTPVKLLGYKRLQYLLWIKQLRSITRYSEKIKIPSKY